MKPIIIRLPNWVGDVIMSIPALEALHAAGFELHLLGKPWIADLLAAFPAKTYLLPSHVTSVLSTIRVIRSIPAKNAIVLPNSFNTALTLYCAKKIILGYTGNWRTWLIHHPITKTKGIHEVEYFWKIAQHAAATWAPEAPWPDHIPHSIMLPISAQGIRLSKQALAQNNIDSPYIVLCPFAMGLTKQGESKIWPYWKMLSQELSQKGFTCIVCPTPAELHQCTTLVPQARILTNIGLNTYAAVMQNSQFVIANDSGPMHIAAAVGVPTLGIFGTSSPLRTFPWGAHYIGKQGQWPSIDQVLDTFYNLLHNAKSNGIQTCSKI